MKGLIEVGRGCDFKFNIGYVSGDIEVVDRYKKLKFRKGRNPENEKRYKYKCNKCGWEDGDVSESNLKRGTGCSSCSGRTVTPMNNIWSNARWMCKWISEEDAKRYTPQSGKSITVVCPDCGKEKIVQINNIYHRRSIQCSCGDGTSYPEKFMMSVLNQLDVEFEGQLSKAKFEWCGDKKYDFYIFNNNTIIETHGIQHYKDSKRGRSLKEEQENDKLKRELAFKHGINKYIIIDCRYSDLEYIKNNIIKSELANIFDLSKIDWIKCEEYALKNRIKEVAQMWNNKKTHETTVDIAKKCGLSRSTIYKYLNKANKLKWCNYDSRKELIKNGKRVAVKNEKAIEVFTKKGDSLGVFRSASELERQSVKHFGDILYTGGISLTCQGKRKQYKGYMFKYIEDDISCFC